MNAPQLSRREFAAALGGIVVSFSLAPGLALGQQQAPLPGSLNGNRLLDAWLRINQDGTAIAIVTVVANPVQVVTLENVARAQARSPQPVEPFDDVVAALLNR